MNKFGLKIKNCKGKIISKTIFSKCGAFESPVFAPHKGDMLTADNNDIYVVRDVLYTNMDDKSVVEYTLRRVKNL